MLPRATFSDIPDIALANTVSRGERNIAFRAAPNIPNVLFGKFRFWMIYSYRCPASALLHTIRHIVGVRSQKKMISVDARPIVTAMQDTKLRIKRTVTNLIGYAVSEMNRSSHSDDAVSTGVFIRRPVYASISSLNRFEAKALVQRNAPRRIFCHAGVSPIGLSTNQQGLM